MRRIAWRRVVPGLYESTNGVHRIVRQWFPGEGPKGGVIVEWWCMHRDEVLRDWVIDGPGRRTLREVKIAIEEDIRNGWLDPVTGRVVTRR